MLLIRRNNVIDNSYEVSKDYLPSFPDIKYCSESDFIKDGVRYIVPMTAKELTEDEDKNNALLDTANTYVEEKFDGTRGILQFFKYHTRCFSRRISERTKWFCENTDSLPQLKSIGVAELEGTILDGELFIDGRPFKDVASILNCKWDKAIQRQQEMGFISIHVFDILYYKGVNIENKPLKERKIYLEKVCKILKDKGFDKFIKKVPYFDKSPIFVEFSPDLYKKLKQNKSVYPNLWKDIELYTKSPVLPKNLEISKKSYYDYIVLKNGEGVIVKDKDGLYLHKRGWEYSKIKKFLTREVIIIGFNPPNIKYTGKFPNNEWDYWLNTETNEIFFKTNSEGFSSKCIPITRYYYEDWIGTIRFGVIVTDEDIKSLSKTKKFNIVNLNLEGVEYKVLEVGECGGFIDSDREYISKHKEEFLYKTMEVKANEIFKDTGKLRHPRFLRMREDKSPTNCTFTEHLFS